MLLDDDRARICHILDALQEAIGYVKGISRAEFNNNRPLQHSVVRCIEIVGEASNHLSRQLREANPCIPWVDIIGMRNRIVHTYYDIDVEIVWKTATEDLPALLPEVQAIAQTLMRTQ